MDVWFLGLVDFWAVDVNVPSEADCIPLLCSLVMTAWGRHAHGQQGKLAGPSSRSFLVKLS